MTGDHTAGETGEQIRAIFDRARPRGAYHDILQTLAEGVTEVAGFAVAAISVLRRSGDFEVVAVAGDAGARDQLMGNFTPRAEIEAELAQADDWGALRFVPHSRLPEGITPGWVPDLEPVEDDPDAWHPLDLLMAPLRDEHGDVVGLLSVDLPASGRRPDAAQRACLTDYAERSGRALAQALQQRELSEGVRLAAAARQIVRRASAQLDVEGILAHCATEVVTGFQALGMWLQVFDEQGLGPSTLHSRDGTIVDLPRRLKRFAESAARAAWEQHQVAVSAHGRRNPGLLPDDEHREVLDFLGSIGVRSMVLVPLGAGSLCLGSLVLTRGPDAPPWSDIELATAQEMGHDLGRALSNARLLEREKRLAENFRDLAAYRSQLVDTLAHELKTPVTSIVGHLELLVDELLSGEHAETSPAQVSLRAMERGTRRLLGVLDDLLSLARTSDPTTIHVAQPVDLVSVVDRAVDAVGYSARRKSVRIVVETGSSPVMVTGDPDALERCCVNLLGNAVKYSPRDSAVSIVLHERPREIELSISDEGLGISEEDQERLFTEFFRSTNPTALQQPGTGLGLVIVERTVARHGGRIEVDSQLGKGSTFRVILPRP
ncbi:ATP-binding protein [Nocardioides sp.]|uniref:sensor histidine kinase n=1 Tax=Nocardioides sp. TaxID=35761 RepID=UPI0027347B37|nr:ATP-binding protein [Nocardioides sp.]MDP3891293.1 ATP-binding protein [Nocardioides sp.]